MEIIEDSPSCKIISRLNDPDNPYTYTCISEKNKKCPNNVFRKESFKNYNMLNRFYNSYNYYIIPECHNPFNLNNHFNVERNIYYDTLIFYNSLENEPLPESLLSWIECLSEVVLCLVNYNHPLDNLPKSVRVLILESRPTSPNHSLLSPSLYQSYFEYSHSLDNLPINLSELILKCNFTGNLDYLPVKLLHLKISNPDSFLTMYNLPTGLLKLKLPYNYKHSLKNNLPHLKILGDVY
jgi:hypothetical protein